MPLTRSLALDVWQNDVFSRGDVLHVYDARSTRAVSHLNRWCSILCPPFTQSLLSPRNLSFLLIFEPQKSPCLVLGAFTYPSTNHSNLCFIRSPINRLNGYFICQRQLHKHPSIPSLFFSPFHNDQHNDTHRYDVFSSYSPCSRRHAPSQEAPWSSWYYHLHCAQCCLDRWRRRAYRISIVSTLNEVIQHRLILFLIDGETVASSSNNRSKPRLHHWYPHMIPSPCLLHPRMRHRLQHRNPPPFTPNKASNFPLLVLVFHQQLHGDQRRPDIRSSRGKPSDQLCIPDARRATTTPPRPRLILILQ